MKLLISVLFVAFAVAVQTEHIDIDWSQVKPISELPEYKDALDNIVPVGESIESRRRPIIAGKSASVSQFPYQAGLIMKVSESNYLCGGSLISSTRVLTAAHCAKDVSSAIIILGAMNLYEYEPFQVRISVPASAIVSHPQYNSKTFQNDIAIIKLPSAVVFNYKISSIELADSLNDFYGITAIVSGWGNFDYTRHSSSYLRFANMNVIENPRCRNDVVAIYETTICAMGEGNISTCHGDSGGPLAVKLNGKKILIGVTSFGIDKRCGSGLPVGFSRVTSFMPWIKSNM